MELDTLLFKSLTPTKYKIRVSEIQFTILQYLCDHSALLHFYVPPIIKKRLLDTNIEQTDSICR